MKYHVIITLSDGNQIDCNVEGVNLFSCLKKMYNTKEVRDFIGDAEITDMNVSEVKAEPETHSLERYDVMEFGDHVQVTDLALNFGVVFRKGEFNDNEVIRLENCRLDELDALEAAKAMRSIADHVIALKL